jgi:hypothetical protein
MFSPVFVLDKESCCFQRTQDFDIVIQIMELSLSSTFSPSHMITTGLSVVVSELLPDGEPI